MSYWNYRIVKHKDHGEEVFSIFEVYYNEDGSVYAYTEEPSNPVSYLESPIEIADACGKIAIACAKPVLTLEDLESMLSSVPNDITIAAMNESLDDCGSVDIDELFDQCK